MSKAATFRYRKKFCKVRGKTMAYLEHGDGDPIVFLHGNPTSSYLWRNIMPYLEGEGRLIAPDLIGMGHSDKLDDSGADRYGYFEQRDYLFDLLDQLGVRARVTLVIHDWGSALGFDWARQHPESIKGIAFMEAITAPMPSWEQFPEGFRAIFQALRSDAGEAMTLSDNAFVEQVLPGASIRRLEDYELAEYRRPFSQAGEDRRPTLSWPRHLPIAGEPAAIVALATDYAAWLSTSSFPKLFVNAEPGGLLTGELRKAVRRWPNIKEVTVQGIHFIQEDSPDEIGRAIAHWLINI